MTDVNCEVCVGIDLSSPLQILADLQLGNGLVQLLLSLVLEYALRHSKFEMEQVGCQEHESVSRKLFYICCIKKEKTKYVEGSWTQNGVLGQ